MADSAGCYDLTAVAMKITAGASRDCIDPIGETINVVFKGKRSL